MRTVFRKISGLAAAARVFCSEPLLSGLRHKPERPETPPNSVIIAAAGVAHDLNNLLMLIIGNSHLAIRDVRDPVLSRPWKEILEAAQTAAELTERFVAASRQEALELRPISPNSVIQGALSLLGRLAGDRVVIRTALADDAGTILVNPTDLLRVLMNLVLNARDAMSSSGTVLIETRRRLLSRDRKPAYVIITVADTGPGIDESAKSRVFDAFFSTKQNMQTAGLGLTIVESIVRKSGGHVEVSTQGGVGTAFHLCFPPAEA